MQQYQIKRKGCAEEEEDSYGDQEGWKEEEVDCLRTVLPAYS